MSKIVYGVFNSREDVIQSINNLKKKGFTGEDMTLVADKKETLEYTNGTPTLDVNKVTNNTEQDSFMEKVKNFFMGDEQESFTEKLINSGLSKDTARAYVSDVKAGNILLLIEEDAQVKQVNPLAKFNTSETATRSSDEIVDSRETLNGSEFHGTNSEKFGRVPDEPKITSK